jgi:collagen type VII alpha
MKTPQIVIGVVAALALAGGGFAAGMTFERSQTPSTNTAGTTGTTGARGASGGRGGFGAGGTGAAAGQQPVTGRIIAVNDGSITVAAVDRAALGGQNAQASASPTTTSEIVLVGASTRIVKTTEADVKLSDLKVNDQVTIVGTTDATGMVSATAIVVGSTNILGQLFGSQTGSAGLGGGARPSASPTKAP